LGLASPSSNLGSRLLRASASILSLLPLAVCQPLRENVIDISPRISRGQGAVSLWLPALYWRCNDGGLAVAGGLFFMKTILIVVLLACAFSGGACSRSDKQQDAAAQSSPNSSLKADAERLQRATAKAAEQRKRDQAQESPTPGVPPP